MAIALGVSAIAVWLLASALMLLADVRKQRRTVAELRAIISDQEFMIESFTNRAYERGWCDRTAFSAPMPFGRVKPAREKSN